jgi:two-component system, LytTR family, sensor kinase
MAQADEIELITATPAVATQTAAGSVEHLQHRPNHNRFSAKNPLRELTKNRRRTLITGAIIVGWWTFLAILFTPQTYMVNLRATAPLSVPEAFFANAVLFYVWAALTPLVLLLGRVFPLERGRWLRNLSVLFILSFPIAFLQVLVVSKLTDLLAIVGDDYSPPVPIKALLLGLGATNIMIYWGILAVSQALNYFRRYKDREASLAHAQLQMMRMQLNPHFLFNTLNAISELVYDTPEIADRTVTKLSDLLRLSLKGDQPHEVPLQEELSFLEKYVDIQRTLHEERLKFAVDVAPETLSAAVPNMLLQPLVENAIRHGIAPKAQGGQIHLYSRIEDRMLIIEIRDNGLGMRAGLSERQTDGIGLRNTISRLTHLYGKDHRFELKGTEGGGVTVLVAVPFKESE